MKDVDLIEGAANAMPQRAEDVPPEYEECIRAYHALVNAGGNVTRHLERELGIQFSLRVNEFDVLVALSSRLEERVALSSILEWIDLSQPALSRLVDRLESRGLLIKQPGHDDRRSVALRISDAGRTLVARAIPVHAECVENALLKPLTIEERHMFKSMLSKIAAPRA